MAGTNLMIMPELWRGLTALRFLSPDGQCHSFDSRANGYGRGEGMGVIVIKPLTDALKDNDVIRAVIRVSRVSLLSWSIFLNDLGVRAREPIRTAKPPVSLCRALKRKLISSSQHTRQTGLTFPKQPTSRPMELALLSVTPWKYQP